MTWESEYDEEGPDTLVRDLETGTATPLALNNLIGRSDTRFQLEPFEVDDEGQFLFVHQVCGCEVTPAGTWQVEVAIGDVTRLDTLVDLDSWFLSSLDSNGRGLLAVSTEREPSNEGPGDNLLPPTTVRILDLESLDVGELLVDEERT